MNEIELALLRKYEISRRIDGDLLYQVMTIAYDRNCSNFDNFCLFLETRLSDFRVLNCALKLLEDFNINSIHSNSATQSLASSVNYVIQDVNGH